MKKILIVDDEQDIVESLKFVLEASDYACYCAYNGEDGLKLAKELVPDLMILDVMMPKINGYKISRLLKYDNKNSKILDKLIKSKIKYLNAINYKISGFTVDKMRAGGYID